ncbi:MAG TPA: hypothetical protein HA257_09525 [Candidatus Methanoperedenaceae archaeon]|nr:hypothetical protein [Candidatus Methanoperedenaceae archaeon]
MMIDQLHAWFDTFNQIILTPLVGIAFVLITYVVVHFWTSDPDTVKSKLFLNYDKFKKAFMLFALIAFLLLLHVFLVFIRNYVSSDLLIQYGSAMRDIQLILGLIMAIGLTFFAYVVYGITK